MAGEIRTQRHKQSGKFGQAFFASLLGYANDIDLRREAARILGVKVSSIDLVHEEDGMIDGILEVKVCSKLSTKAFYHSISEHTVDAMQRAARIGWSADIGMCHFLDGRIVEHFVLPFDQYRMYWLTEVMQHSITYDWDRMRRDLCGAAA